MQQLGLETRIKLNKWKPRWYQEEVLYEWLINKKRKIFYCWGRRSGKDYLAFNLAVLQAATKVCMILYCLPTYSQARRCVFDAISIDGIKFLDLIPKELIAKINVQEMKITFINGSIIRIIGADDNTVDKSIVGTNAQMVILSEASLMNLEKVYGYIRPILAANEGTIIIFGTPRGKNAFFNLYSHAKEDPNWFVSYKPTSETRHISDEALAEEKISMSQDLYEQEYEVSFSRGVEGQIYGRELEKARLEGRIGFYPHQPHLLTHYAIDIGVKDATTIIWFQVPNEGNGPIFIIDSYSNTGMGLDHYARVIEEKPYRRGTAFAPHDISVREWGSGAVTRYERARQMGIDFHILEQHSVQDGIDHVKMLWPRFHIHEQTCKSLLDALENYKREYDEKLQIYKSKPLHNWASNYCFSADTLILTRNGERRIIDIVNNDEVLTLEGWKRCSRAYMTKRNAQLVEITFKDNTLVKCTPDHLFLTENGWRSAEMLRPYSKIRSSLMESPIISMATYIEYFLDRLNISLKEAVYYIEMFGEMLLEKFQKVVTSITRMEILASTIYGTSSVYQLTNIEKFPNLTTKDLVRNVEKRLRLGIPLQKDFFGINEMRKERRIGRNGSEYLSHVSIVERFLIALLEVAHIQGSSALPIAGQPIVENVRRLQRTEDVYCISVPEVGHFSLANGAIVKNCDALRYVCQSIHLTKPGMTSQEFDRLKAQALYGNNNLPFPFNYDPRYDKSGSF